VNGAVRAHRERLAQRGLRPFVPLPPRRRPRRFPPPL
jgi:hypothetical protein